MRGLNKVLLMGNVGSDPEVRSTNTGKKVCNFSLATNETKDHTEWHRVVAWEKTAEIIESYVRKGSPLFVEGRIATRKYEKDGRDVYATEIVAYQVILLGSKDDAQTVESRPVAAGSFTEDEALPF